jgi:hypothetical protein
MEFILVAVFLVIPPPDKDCLDEVSHAEAWGSYKSEAACLKAKDADREPLRGLSYVDCVPMQGSK